MTLHDTDALVIETATAAENLPDPATVPGRTHDLTATGTVATAWSSVGVNPFTDAAGANVATLTVLPGDTVRVQSQASKWRVIIPSGSVRRVFSATAVSDAAGNAVFTFTPAFPSIPVAEAAVQAAATNNPIDYRITALTAAGCTIHVRQSPVLIVLSLSVLGVSAPLAGVTVHLTALTPGQGV